MPKERTKYRRYPLERSQLSLDRVGPNAHFPYKLHSLLNECEEEGKKSIISWMSSGKAFQVHDRERFTKEVMPKYFNTSNYRSFQRNLSLWGFQTVIRGPFKGSISHVDFVRLDVDRCCRIQRHALAAGHDHYPSADAFNRHGNSNGNISSNDVPRQQKPQREGRPRPTARSPSNTSLSSISSADNNNDGSHGRVELSSTPTAAAAAAAPAAAPVSKNSSTFLSNYDSPTYRHSDLLSPRPSDTNSASTTTTTTTTTTRPSSSLSPNIESLIALANLVQPNDAEGLVRNMLLQLIVNSLAPRLSVPQPTQAQAPSFLNLSHALSLQNILNQANQRISTIAPQQQQQQQQQQESYLSQLLSPPPGASIGTGAPLLSPPADSANHANAVALLQSLLSSAMPSQR